MNVTDVFTQFVVPGLAAMLTETGLDEFTVNVAGLVLVVAPPHSVNWQLNAAPLSPVPTPVNVSVAVVWPLTVPVSVVISVPFFAH